MCCTPVCRRWLRARKYEKGGGGVWDPKSCVPKMAQQDIVNFPTIVTLVWVFGTGPVPTEHQFPCQTLFACLCTPPRPHLRVLHRGGGEGGGSKISEPPAPFSFSPWSVAALRPVPPPRPPQAPRETFVVDEVVGLVRGEGGGREDGGGVAVGPGELPEGPPRVRG